MKLILLLLAPTLFFSFDKKEKADLEIVSIERPQYVDEINGSSIEVKIKNSGNKASVPTQVLLKDWDGGDEDDWEEDMDWELELPLPSLQAGETINLIFQLNDHWVYDPNCELEAIIDIDNLVEEDNKNNNSMIFMEEG